jgi:tetratricopeptide (TPR) repeat protein
MLLLCYGIRAEKVQHSQNREQDSLMVNELLAKDLFSHYSPDSVLQLANEALAISQRSNLVFEVSRCLNLIGNVHNIKGDYNTALAFYQKANKWLIDHQISDGRLFSSTLNMGRIKVLLGEFVEGIDLLEDALRFAEKNQNDLELCIAYINLGHVFFDIERFDVSREYYLKGLYYAFKSGNKVRISGLLSDLGNIYYKQQDYKNALRFYKRALKIKGEEGDAYGESINLINIGSSYQMLAEKETNPKQRENYVKQAFTYFNKAQKINKQFDIKSAECLAMVNEGLLHLQIGNFLKGVNACHEAERLSDETGEVLRKQDVYDCLYNGYKKLNKPDKALTYFEKYNQSKENMINSESLKRANRLQFEREFAYRQALQKAEIEKERAVAEVKNRQQQFKILILLILLGLCVVILLLLAYQRKRTIENYKTIVKKNIELMKSEAELLAFKEKENTEQVFNKASANFEESEEELEEELAEATIKQAKTTLPPEQVKHLFTEIDRVLIKEKVFLNPDLTLSNLAEMLNSNTAYVSKAINLHYEKSFSNVINEFRIKEARRMLADKKFNHITIEGIARETGFRSMPSFNRAFKNLTGVSPSFFKQNAQTRLDE